MATANILLPKQFDGLSLSKVAADLVAQSGESLPSEISIDFGSLTFIRPAGVVFLSNLIHWLNENGATVSFSNLSNTSAALSFLDDALFFKQHCGQKLRPQANPRNTTRPLIKIAHRDSHAWLDTNLLPWLAGRLAITEASLYIFKACISELFNNIQDHTRFDIGSMFAQHFPSEKTVIISVSDFGLGIPEKVREKIPGISDSDAIMQAVEEGFTTKSKPTNKGIGLDYLLRVAVMGNGGRVTIYSGSGIVRFVKSGTILRPVVLGGDGFCPGTTFDITLRTDTIEVLPEEREELQW